jgi:hypothetical protein
MCGVSACGPGLPGAGRACACGGARSAGRAAPTARQAGDGGLDSGRRCRSDRRHRAGDAQRAWPPGPRARPGGRRRAARRGAPVPTSTARPLASPQLTRDRPVTSRLAAGEQSRGAARRGRDRCDAGFAAKRGDSAGAPVCLRKGPGRGRRCPGPSRGLWPDEAGPGCPAPGVRRGACTLGCADLSLVRSRPAQPGAGAREEGGDFADGGFLGGGPGQREAGLDLVAVAAAVFLLDHVAGCGQAGEDAVGAALGNAQGWPRCRAAARPGRGRCAAAPGRGRSGSSSSPPLRTYSLFPEIYC